MDKQKKKKKKNSLHEGLETITSSEENFSDNDSPAEPIATVNQIIEVDNVSSASRPQISIGKFLRDAREAKHLSLKNISLHTKISLTILENIENNEFRSLPSKPYTLGFIKAYAKTLGANLTEAQKILDDSYSQYLNLKADSNITNIKNNNAQNPTYRYITPYLVWGLISIIGIFSIAMLFKKNANQADNISQNREKIVTHVITERTPLVGQEEKVTEAEDITKVEAPVSAVANTGISENEKVLNLGELKIKETKLLSEIEKNAAKTPVAVTESPKLKEELQKKLMAQEIKEEFTPIPTPLFTYITETVDQKGYSYLPSNVKASFVKGIENVYVVAATADTWITYKKDNDPIKKFILKKERSVLIRGSNIRIFLGNANATKIFLNNQLVDTQTKTGVKSLVFPEVNIAKYVLPLFIYKDNGEVLTSEDYLNSLPR